MSYLDRIRRCRRLDPSHFRPFVVEDTAVGHVKHDFARCLAAWERVFDVSGDRVVLRPGLGGFAGRSEALEAVLRRLAERGDLYAWRDEPYPVVPRWGAVPLLRMDRAAVPCFGVPAFGIHVNGYVRDGGGIRLWVGRRSATSYTDPGKLDHLVAGGHPMGLGLRENLAKEADEEAGISPELAREALPVGTFRYRMEIERGMRHDTIFLWDLELPAAFRPRNRDGEIDAFELWPLDRVMRTVRDTEAFKFNVGPVIVDFLLRHGRLDPEAEDYVAIAGALRG